MSYNGSCLCGDVQFQVLQDMLPFIIAIAVYAVNKAVRVQMPHHLSTAALFNGAKAKNRFKAIIKLQVLLLTFVLTAALHFQILYAIPIGSGFHSAY